MKKLIVYISLLFTFLSITPISYAADDITTVYELRFVTPIPYDKQNPDQSCPPQMDDIYKALEEHCASSYEDFLTDPIKKHYWIEDPAITAQGKADERARQFLYWVLTTNAIDDAPVLRQIWNTASLIALFGVVLIAAIFGIGYIISSRTNFDFKIRIWPTLIKLGIMLLYVVLSSAFVLLLVQLSEVMMRFFIDTLGGKDLFNVYFSTPSSSPQTLLGSTERSYKEFIGGRDLNIRVQEAIQAEIYLLKLTNITYYVMGVMLLLRKILLWFLLFVSPFLALLMPFILIRNIGWIWIGVFFQWLFYGPLLALFLGATSKIWQAGIPFNFDFSRVTIPGDPSGFKPEGYVYPTGINIVYGGPGQNGRFIPGVNRAINAANNGNYVDTFAEYVITLIMLWAVTFFPWWLLRIFRDYCCEGIYAMRNILLAMYDQMRMGPPPKGPSPTPPGKTPPSVKIETPTPVKTNVVVSLGSLEAIKKTISRDIAKNLNLEATKLTDIARLETNKQSRQTVIQNITYLSNPVKAQIPAERQQYMNLRSELRARAIKSDSIAQTILASTSTSTTEKVRIREEITRSLPTEVSISQVTVNSLKLPKEKIYTITNNYTESVINNNKTIQNLAKTTNTSTDQVKNILHSYTQHTSTPPSQIIKVIAKETNTSPTTVKQVLNQNGAIGKYISKIHESAVKENVPQEKVVKLMDSLRIITVKSPPSPPPITQHISNKVQVPPTVVKDVVSKSFGTVTLRNDTIQQIAQEVHVDAPQVKATIEAYVKGVNNDVPPTPLIQHISQEQHLDQKTVTQILDKAGDVAQKTQITHEIAKAQKIQPEKANTILNLAVNSLKVKRKKEAPPIIQQISGPLQVPPNTAKDVVVNTFSTISSNSASLQQIAQETQVEVPKIQATLGSYVNKLDQSPVTVINAISKDQDIEKKKVTQIIQSVSKIAETSNITNQIAQALNVSPEKVSQILQVTAQASDTAVQVKGPSVMNQISEEIQVLPQQVQQFITNTYSVLDAQQPVIQQIANEHNVSASQVEHVLNSFVSQVDQPHETVIQNIATTEQMEAPKVVNILKSVNSILTTTHTIQQEAQQLNIPPQKVTHIFQTLTQPSVSKTVQSKPIIETVTQQLHVLPQTAKEVINNTYQSVASQESLVQQIAQETQVPVQKVQATLGSYVNKLDISPSQAVENISKEQAIDQPTVTNIIHSATRIAETNNLTHQIAQQKDISPVQASQILQLSNQSITEQPQDASIPVVEMISSQLQIPAQNVKEFITNTYSSLDVEQPSIQQIASENNVSTSQVKQVMTSYASHIDQPHKMIIQEISSAEQIDINQVENIVKATNNVLYASEVTQQEAQNLNIQPQKSTQILEKVAEPPVETVQLEEESVNEPIVRMISYTTDINEATSKSIIQNIMNEAVSNEHILSAVQEQTGLQPEQVKNVISTFSQNITQPRDVIIETISQTSGIPTDKVESVVASTADIITSEHDVIQNVAQKEGLKEEDVAKTIHTQMNLASQPEEHIEQTITIPSTVSIEDYEQVKDMWTKHYEEGEIPVSEQIKSRKEWIEQEIVYITNTLNKILSSDEQLRQEGLDELGFLLPIFLINNLKGEELVVYLKAKLEAAKSVAKLLEKEEEIKSEYEKKEEEEEVLVDAPEKEEEPKAMEMPLEEEEQAPKTIEDRVQAVQEKLSNIEEESQKAEEPHTLDDIKSRLQEKAEKNDSN